MLARRRQQEEAKKKLPEVLDMQKRKLLIAIKQTPDGATEKFSEEQEKVVMDVLETLQPLAGGSLEPFSEWDESKATKSVNESLKKHALFQLAKYLKCAKNICVVFANKEDSLKYSTTTLQIVHISMKYVLIHAREFGDSSKCIFQQDEHVAMDVKNQSDINTVEEETSVQLGIVDRAKQLIDELQKVYDEAKFTTLNAIVTMFALVIVRRFIKLSQGRHRHAIDYLACMKKCNECLIVYAYLTTKDDKTKKNLYDTCIKHMEWYGMKMPSLFFKVLDLYNIEMEKLWDAIISIDQMTHIELMIKLSLVKFAKVYYDMYQKHTHHWLPFCRFFDHRLQENLCDEKNTRICMMLQSLMEMANKKDNKLPKNDYYVPLLSQWAQEVAGEIFIKITK